MPVPKKKAAIRARRASAADDARDAVIAEHMARTQLALCQQAEMMAQMILAMRGLTEQTAAMSAQVAALKLAALKRKKQGARQSR